MSGGNGIDYGYTIDNSDIGRDERIAAATIPWIDTLSSTMGNEWVHNPLTEYGDIANEFLANNPAFRAPVEAIGEAASALPVIGAPLQALGLMAKAQPGGDADRLIDAHTLNQQYGQSLGLSFDTPQRKGAVDLIVAAKREQNTRDFILAHGPQGFSARTANFLTSLAVSAADPLNVGAAFVPILGETRAALLAEKLGPTLGRFATGAAAGGTITAAFQPVEALRDHIYEEQYGPTEAFMNVAFGTLLGGGIHAGLGALADRMLASVKPAPVMRH